MLKPLICILTWSFYLDEKSYRSFSSPTANLLRLISFWDLLCTTSSTWISNGSKFLMKVVGWIIMFVYSYSSRLRMQLNLFQFCNSMWCSYDFSKASNGNSQFYFISSAGICGNYNLMHFWGWDLWVFRMLAVNFNAVFSPGTTLIFP